MILEGGVLIGAVNVTSAPYVSPGGAYFLASQQPPLNAFLTVDVNCLETVPIPGTSQTAPVLVPFHYGAPIMGAASAGVPTTLDCSVDEVIWATEAVDMIVTVAGYNAAIEAAAAARDWAYWDPNVLLNELQQHDPRSILLFPAHSPLDPQHATEPFAMLNLATLWSHFITWVNEAIVEALMITLPVKVLAELSQSTT